jgi:hypothetical protein
MPLRAALATAKGGHRCGGLRPALTASARSVGGFYGRDRKTTLNRTEKLSGLTLLLPLLLLLQPAGGAERAVVAARSRSFALAITISLRITAVSATSFFFPFSINRS